MRLRLRDATALEVPEADYHEAQHLRLLLGPDPRARVQPLAAKYWADKIAMGQAEAHKDATLQGYVAIDRAKSKMPPPADFVARVRAAVEADVGSATDRLLRAAGGEAPA